MFTIYMYMTYIHMHQQLYIYLYVYAYMLKCIYKDCIHVNLYAKHRFSFK